VKGMEEDSGVPGFVRLWEGFTREKRWMAGVVGVGLVLVAIGAWQFVRPKEPVVEIVRQEGGGGDGQGKGSELYVDIAGEVEKPGVYALPAGARIGEALTAAGGVASGADRGWVARFVNLAAPVSDGMKIYIPAEGESGGSGVSYASGASVVGGGESLGVEVGQGKVNINTASETELDALWGIGPARARDIITNRPYGSIEELTTRAGIPKNVYERIEDQVSVY